MGYKITLPDMEIRDKYLIAGLSSTDLAKIYHCDCVTILNHLKRLGVEIRDRQVARRMPICRAKAREARANQEAPPVWSDKARGKSRESRLNRFIPVMPRDDLSRLYCGELLSAFDIGRQVGCSRTTIINLLRRYELPVRPRSWIRKGQRILSLSIDEITKMYVEWEMSLQKIGKACDCDAGTIVLRLRQDNVTIRHCGETYKERLASSERMIKFHKNNPESFKGRNNPFYGKQHSYETRAKIKQARARQFFTKEMLLRRGEATKRVWASYTDEERNKRIRQMRVNAKPNKPERYLLNLLEFMFPNEWRYTGDGALMIRGKNPDFANVNGQKKLIELFGTYWHRNENPKDRIRLYRGYGYETLVIWEHELCNQKRLLRRIIDFAMAGKD